MRGRPGRGALERSVRGAWGDPGSVLRALAALYGTAVDLRNLLWDAGVFRPRRVSVPVVSVGGLSTGGSGKTPLAAALARHLADAGARVAVLTPGQEDELRLHAALNPDLPVSGGRWRIPLAEAAVREGARVLLLDSGFQHRRLHRDLEIVACNVDQAGNRQRLPAGPYRERFTALRRADAVVLVRRAAGRARSLELAEQVAGVAPRARTVEVRLRPGPLRAGNRAAGRIETPAPAAAVAGVMWPESFFRWLDALDVRPDHRFTLSDHARYDDRTLRRIAAAAGEAGLVCTRKDAVRLADLVPDATPVWWLEEQLVWGAGAPRLLAGLRRVAELDDG
ncbi:MAG: tetraacyldisaccharide 4'-kinase [Gemmatimonadota bacterium]